MSGQREADAAWRLLCSRLNRDPATSEESDTCSLRAAWKAMLAFSSPATERWRHVKRGTEYTVVGRGELQASCDALVDGSAMVVYRGDDGRIWVREEAEFEDGRFVRLDTGSAIRRAPRAHIGDKL